MDKISSIIVETQPRFSQLVNGQKLIEKIKSALKEIDLFKQYADSYRVIKYSQNILYLNVSSSAFATRVRLSSGMILQTLNKTLSPIEFNIIQCQVNAKHSVARSEPAYQKNKLKAMSEQTKKRLIQLSEKTATEKLSAALKKLVS